LDRALAGRDFIVGEYSIADIATYPWVTSWERQGQVLSTFPNVSAWMERMGTRPAVKRGMSAALK
jgi:GST-like protein